MSVLVSDVINLAYLELSVISPQETISTAMQTDAFARLLSLLGSLNAEGLTIPQQVSQAWQLTAATSAYTLGSGGTLATTGTLRAQKVTAWRAYYSTVLSSGGRVLSLTEFGERARQLIGENSSIPSIVGADTAYPLINVRVFPPPSGTPGYLELDYWTPILDFASVETAITLPPGWVRILTFLLAQDLFGTYGRPSLAQYIAGMAKDAKAALIVQNSMGAPEPVPSAPQGQV